MRPSHRGFYEKYFPQVKKQYHDVIEHLGLSDEWLRQHIVFSKTFSGRWSLSTKHYRNPLMLSKGHKDIYDQVMDTGGRNLVREYVVSMFPDIPFNKREQITHSILEEIKNGA